MSLTVRCDGCGRTLKVSDELAGKRGKCPGCGNVIEVPASSPQDGAGGAPLGEFPEGLELAPTEYTPVPAAERRRPQAKAGVDPPSRLPSGRREMPRRPRAKRRLVVDLPIVKLAIVLAIVGALCATWQFVVRPAGERFRIRQAFQQVRLGKVDVGLSDLAELKEKVTETNRELVELRYAQAQLFQPPDSPLGAGPTLTTARLTRVKYQKSGKLQVFALTIENPLPEPLVLSNAFFFFKGALLPVTDRRAAPATQALATEMLGVVDVAANTLDGAEIPPGGSVDGTVAFLGLPIRSLALAGAERKQPTNTVLTLVYNDGNGLFEVPVDAE